MRLWLNSNCDGRAFSFMVVGLVKRCLFLCLIAWGLGAAAEPSGPPVPKEVAAWIRTYASSQAAGGRAPTYYPGGTKIAQGRLGNKSTAAIVFTLEGVGGGNNYSQYLAVFWKRGAHYVYCCSRLVGGKGIRSVEQVALRGTSIRIGGKDYVPGADPMCCPSKPYTTDLAVENAQLVELRASNVMRTKT